MLEPPKRITAIIFPEPQWLSIRAAGLGGEPRRLARVQKRTLAGVTEMSALQSEYLFAPVESQLGSVLTSPAAKEVGRLHQLKVAAKSCVNL